MAIETYKRFASDVITAVTRQFGDEAQIQIDEADIIRWINAGQREIITNNNSINRTSAVTAIVANQTTYPLDGDPAFEGVQNIFTVMVNGIPYKALSFQDAILHHTMGETANIWYTQAGLLNIHPAPVHDYPNGLAIYFIKAAPEITTPGDTLGVPDNFYNALVQYVLQQAYELDENFQAAGVKAQQFEKSVNIQQNQNEVQTAFYPIIADDPEDYY